MENYFKDMEERELREQYEYLQEWSKKHPKKQKTGKQTQKVFKRVKRRIYQQNKIMLDKQNVILYNIL